MYKENIQIDNKINELIEILGLNYEDIKVELFKNSWFEVNVYIDTVEDKEYLVLNAHEIYYNYDMFELDQKIEYIGNEYNIYEIV